ncbi:MAG: rod shape-determining protein MreC [Planctomycetota bacterium]
MNFRLRLPTKGQTFTILMIVSAALMLLPVAWTSWLRGAVQILGLPQWSLSVAGRSVRQIAETTQLPEYSPEEVEQLNDENEELRRLLWHQHAWLLDLEQRYEEICGLRGQLRDQGARILVAPVLAYDSSALRDTLLIGRGAAHGVRPGAWVAAGVAVSEHNANETGREILLRQWLVGRISEVHTRVSRVRLVSDPKFGEPHAGERVALARVREDGVWEMTAADHLLTGRGRGEMVISQAEADYCKLGYNLVLIPASPLQPESLSVGKIISSVPMTESALHFELVVEPGAPACELRYVYVILTGSPVD